MVGELLETSVYSVNEKEGDPAETIPSSEANAAFAPYSEYSELSGPLIARRGRACTLQRARRVGRGVSPFQLRVAITSRYSAATLVVWSAAWLCADQRLSNSPYKLFCSWGLSEENARDMGP